MNTMAGTIDGAAGNPGMGARLRAFLAVAPGDRVDATNSAVARLLLSSFLMLFLELALIRWLGANVVTCPISPTSCCSALSLASAQAS